MSLFDLPVDPNGSAQVFEVDLDGRTYRFQIRLNGRDNVFYLNLLDASDNPIRTGIRIVDDWILTARDANFDVRPPGHLITVAVETVDGPPELGELGSDVLMLYDDLSDR